MASVSGKGKEGVRSMYRGWSGEVGGTRYLSEVLYFYG